MIGDLSAEIRQYLRDQERFEALRKARSGAGPTRPQTIDAETREALEALGYAE